MSRVSPHWSTKTDGEPFVPVGMLAPAATVRPLLDRLLQEDDEALARLRMVASPDVAVVLGKATDLPWIDGLIYLRRAGSLLLPSWLELDLDPELVVEALRRQAPTVPLPAAWVPDRGWLVSVAEAAAPEREVLRQRRDACA